MKNNLFCHIDILNKGLNTYWLRDKVISNNIANADTPGYKRQTVSFEDVLRQKCDNNNSLTKELVADVNPKVIKENENLQYRQDGNSVDIDVEMVNRAKNEIDYNIVVSQINNEFRMYQTVLKSK